MLTLTAATVAPIAALLSIPFTATTSALTFAATPSVPADVGFYVFVLRGLQHEL
jgi:hypothetical protein